LTQAVADFERTLKKNESMFQRTLETDRSKIQQEIRTKLARMKTLEGEKEDLLKEMEQLMGQVQQPQPQQ
jgi:hypothetical protein